MAEKKPRKRKSLKVDLENKSENHINDEKIEENSEKIPELDPKKTYEFISNGSFHTLPKGKLWKISGETAMILISKGYGKLKK